MLLDALEICMLDNKGEEHVKKGVKGVSKWQIPVAMGKALVGIHLASCIKELISNEFAMSAVLACAATSTSFLVQFRAYLSSILPPTRCETCCSRYLCLWDAYGMLIGACNLML